MLISTEDNHMLRALKAQLHQKNAARLLLLKHQTTIIHELLGMAAAVACAKGVLQPHILAAALDDTIMPKQRLEALRKKLDIDSVTVQSMLRRLKQLEAERAKFAVPKKPSKPKAETKTQGEAK